MERNCVPISFDFSRSFFFKKLKSNKRKGCYHVQFMLQCCQLYYSESSLFNHLLLLRFGAVLKTVFNYLRMNFLVAFFFLSGNDGISCLYLFYSDQDVFVFPSYRIDFFPIGYCKD